MARWYAARANRSTWPRRPARCTRNLAGLAITALKRYQVVALLGTLLMAVGIFLLTCMTPATALVHAAIVVALAGLGMGAVLSVVGLVALNALPATHLGVGMGAVRYLGQIGGTVGVAIVGTVVNQSLAGDLERRLPATAVKRLAADGVAIATNPQVLVSPTYRVMAVRDAVRTIAARIPAGPTHARLVAAAMRQVRHLLAQVFDALRLSLAVAIHHGLLTVLVFCVAAILGALFVTDMPVAPQPGDVPDIAETARQREDDVSPRPR